MKRYLITSALPYINGIKHLGNLVGSMLPADVYARFLRQQGHQVLYICGTDEHGTPAELAAQTAGMSVAEYCQKMYEVQQGIYKRFDLSFDYFGRSSDPSNKALTQSIFAALDKAGYIDEAVLEQFYDTEAERFLPDRYVLGTCPICHYDQARGDQCEACGRLLNPTDLLEPRSAVSGNNALERRESKHLFLKLSALQPLVADWIQTRGHWSNLTMGIAKKWLQEGLTDRCITRDVVWGVPVPKPGYEDKRFYVWFDAPIAYISMTQDWVNAQGKPDSWRDWWQSSDDVEYVQFMAKDNVPFHAIFWPAMLLGTKQPWKMVDTLKSFNWLNYENGKFSTSQGRGIFTDQALELFPADYWRYYLMAVAPENADSNFTFRHFADVINNDLANQLGNFVNRVTNLIVKHFSAKTPAAPFELAGEILSIHERVQQTVKGYQTALSELKFVQAIQQIKQMWAIANEFITEAAPWKLVKTDKDHAAQVLTYSLYLLKLFAATSHCIIPSLSLEIAKVIGLTEADILLPYDQLADPDMPLDLTIIKPDALVQKISDEMVETLTSQFSGAA